MYRIIDGRGSGKTSRLLLLAKEHNGIIVCSNPMAMEAKARAYGITSGIEFMSYNQYLDGQARGSGKSIFVDELERLTSVLGIGGIEGYTISIED